MARTKNKKHRSKSLAKKTRRSVVRETKKKLNITLPQQMIFNPELFSNLSHLKHSSKSPKPKRNNLMKRLKKMTVTPIPPWSVYTRTPLTPKIVWSSSPTSSEKKKKKRSKEDKLALRKSMKLPFVYKNKLCYRSRKNRPAHSIKELREDLLVNELFDNKPPKIKKSICYALHMYKKRNPSGISSKKQYLPGWGSAINRKELSDLVRTKYANDIKKYLNEFSLDELRKFAKSNKVTGYSLLTKLKLINYLVKHIKGIRKSRRKSPKKSPKYL
jgi:hypothetical protein